MSSHLEQAIRDAVEKGGYDGRGDFLNHVLLVEKRVEQMCKEPERYLLDLAFWRALGKARKWGRYAQHDGKRVIQKGVWQHNWHRLIDHLASGADIESFFASL